MNRPQPQRSRANQRRSVQARRPAPVDVWRSPGALAPIMPIAVADDVGALLRSLGDPPMHGGTAAGFYFLSVVERAAALAAALALSADLLASTGDD